jgi:hypothetical protein
MNGSIPADIGSALNNFTSYLTTISPMYRPSGQFDDAATTAAIGEFTIAFSDRWVNVTPPINTSSFQFLNFMFYYCVKSYNTSVESSVHYTRVVERTTDIVSPLGNSIYGDWNPAASLAALKLGYCPSEIKDQSLELAGAPWGTFDGVFKVDACTAVWLSGVLLGAIPGLILQIEGYQNSAGTGELAYPLSLAIFGDLRTNRIEDSAIRARNIKAMIENIADSFTNL